MRVFIVRPKDSFAVHVHVRRDIYISNAFGKACIARQLNTKLSLIGDESLAASQ